MNNKERLELAKWVAHQAQKKGADNAAADLGKYRQIEVEFRNFKLDVLKESTQNSLDLAIYVNNKYSNSSTCDLRKDSLGKFIDEAIAMTKYLGEDEFRSLPDPKYYEGRQDKELYIYDSGYDSFGSERRVKIAREIEETARNHSEKVVACAGYYTDACYESVKVHSNGFAGSRKSASFSVGLEVTVCDDKECRPNDFDFKTVRYIKDIPNHKKIAIAAVDRAFSKIGQKKADSGKYDMIVENRAGTRLLGALAGPLRARNIQQKNSCLEDKIGEKIASDKLTIIDDPFVEYGLGSRLYDGEGMATKKRIMIEKGVLKSYYVDNYYGKKLGWEPTIGSSTNSTYHYGDKSLDDLIAMMGTGILVTGFIGGNSSSSSGDFSYGIVGQMIKDGKAVHPINEMNVSGNILDLWPKLADVGNDPYTYSSNRRPSMYFKDIDFSGV
ncbi:MAG: TldD/PmbA family protein [candidate division Zixibacteria bacterium]|nr:TldD/PmbA family protein [candidate division Zixibacteria bacterium]